MTKKKINLFTISFFIILFVFAHIYLRMRCVEKDYALNRLRKKFNNISLENKELKAKRAKLLSAKNLWSYARDHDLKEPTSKQIIIISE